MRRRSQGLSMMETVIALFLLLGSFTFLLTMYKQSFSYLQRAEREARANLFADNVLQEVREWASDPVNFADPAWAAWSSVTDPDFPHLEAQLTRSALTRLTPSFSLEQPWPPAERASLVSTVIQVQLQVRWQGTVVTEVVANLIEPPRQVRPTNPVEVRAVGAFPNPLPKDETTRFQARLLDGSGVEIEDLNFVWAVEPVTGNGSLSQIAHDGREAELKNAYVTRAGTTYYTGGECRVAATAIYRGREYTGLSEPVSLEP